MKHFIILTLLFLSSVCFAEPKTVEHKNLNFTVNADELLRGGLRYSFEVLSGEKLLKKYPLLEDFDSLGLLKNKKNSFLLSKAAFVVDQGVGFFDQQTADSETFIAHVTGARVSKIKEGNFLVTDPKDSNLKFLLQQHFDSDYITSVKSSKAEKSVSVFKKMDVLTLSASASLYQEMTNFSFGFVGKEVVYSFIPLKETKTLVLSLSLFSLRSYKNDSTLKQDLLRDFSEWQRRLKTAPESP